MGELEKKCVISSPGEKELVVGRVLIGILCYVKIIRKW